jgi:hypothetical protein
LTADITLRSHPSSRQTARFHHDSGWSSKILILARVQTLKNSENPFGKLGINADASSEKNQLAHVSFWRLTIQVTVYVP